jgi:hypothetical protein
MAQLPAHPGDLAAIFWGVGEDNAGTTAPRFTGITMGIYAKAAHSGQTPSARHHRRVVRWQLQPERNDDQCGNGLSREQICSFLFLNLFPTALTENSKLLKVNGRDD